MSFRQRSEPSLPSSLIDEVGRAAAKHLGVALRPSQIVAGKHLMSRTVVELPTGEGKTLAIVLPASAMVHRGRRVWIATANDYLAARDAAWMQPLYHDLGIRVGSITSSSSLSQRVAAYEADVVYGTIREFGFDHLRSALEHRHAAETAKRMTFGGDALIVDEADSVLIDEARTPLVINMPLVSGNDAIEASYHWAEGFVRELLPDVDFAEVKHSGTVALTAEGRRKALGRHVPHSMRSLTTTDLLHAVELAIAANRQVLRDVHYVVDGEQIALVDEFTGRKSLDRSLGGGFHQAIQAREGLPLTPHSEPVARITVQDFVAKFDHLCGLTATVWEDRQELRLVYQLDVQPVAPEFLSRRQNLESQFFATANQKWEAIASETELMIAANRAVLIGTRTVGQSEELSRRFTERGIPHQTLTARNLGREAVVIAEAGIAGRVTIATNLAGRGTDIALRNGVIDAGGLHVIVSEPHASARIDRQLIGRGARRGDPGSARIYASAEDVILDQAYGQEKADQIRHRVISNSSSGSLGWLDRQRLRIQIAGAQRAVAKSHRVERARLTAHETVLGKAMNGLGIDPMLEPLPNR